MSTNSNGNEASVLKVSELRQRTVFRRYHVDVQNEEVVIPITESTWVRIKAALDQRHTWFDWVKDASLVLFGAGLSVLLSLGMGQVTEAYRLIAVTCAISLIAVGGALLIVQAMRRNLQTMRADELIQDVELDHVNDSS